MQYERAENGKNLISDSQFQWKCIRSEKKNTKEFLKILNEFEDMPIRANFVYKN